MTIDPDTLAGLEALLFIADEPLEMSALALALEVDEDHVLVHLDELAQRLEERQSGLTVRNVADGWRLYTDPATDDVVQRHLLSGRQSHLSQAALETLAVVAYKQPITRGDISDIRGVNADAAVRSLVARGLLEEVGRDDGPGQAVLFGTTTKFLEQLGLVSLDELPELTDHLEDDAPDEPVGTDLRAARRALQDGHRLPSSGRATWDGETVEEEPTDLFARRRERQAAFSELTDDLEQVAEAAMARLQEAVARADAVDEDHGGEGRASGAGEPADVARAEADDGDRGGEGPATARAEAEAGDQEAGDEQQVGEDGVAEERVTGDAPDEERVTDDAPDEEGVTEDAPDEEGAAGNGATAHDRGARDPAADDPGARAGASS